MAQPPGFEPGTVRLEGGCSIQLSYGCVSVEDYENKGFEKNCQPRMLIFLNNYGMLNLLQEKND